MSIIKTSKLKISTFIAAIAKNNRIMTQETMRRALRAMGYPLNGRRGELNYAFKNLRERHGWELRRTGNQVFLFCASDVTHEEAVEYCVAHGIKPPKIERKVSGRHRAPARLAREGAQGRAVDDLTAFVHVVALTYARTRCSQAWRAAA